jgi:methylmalonyl-CoA/ethylmalonyl-CoA epimerase
MNSSDGFSLSEIGQIALTVGNIEEATAFYRDVLGMPFLFEVPGMSFFQCGDTRLLLGESESEQQSAGSSILYYRVDDIDAAHETLKQRGVEFVRDPVLTHKAEDHELWLAFFNDLDGHTLALMCEKPV